MVTVSTFKVSLFFYYPKKGGKKSPQKHHHHHHHHHNPKSVMQLGHLLTRSGLTYPEVSSKVYHDSFCQLGSSVSLPWVIHFEAFYLHVLSSFSCIPIICPKLVLFLTPLQFVHLFCNLSQVYPAVVMRNTIAYPTQQISSPSRCIPCSHERGNDDRVTTV